MLVCSEIGPGVGGWEAVDRFGLERFAAVTKPATRGGPVSDPAEDCELVLRTITGFLRDPAFITATFLPVEAVPLPALVGGAWADGRASAPDTVVADGEARAGPVGGGGGGGIIFDAREAVAGGVMGGVRLTDNGSGGGSISEEVAAVPVETPLLAKAATSTDPGGDTKRAVGRGPDAEGPLDFFKMGWGGGGLEEEGVSDFIPSARLNSCPEWRRVS